MGLLTGDKKSLKTYILRARMYSNDIDEQLDSINLSYYKSVFANDDILGEIIVDVASKGYDLKDSLDKLSVIYMDVVKGDTKEEITTFKNIYNMIRSINSNEDESSYGYKTEIYDLLSPVYDNKSLVLEAMINIKNILDLDTFNVPNEENLEKLLKYPNSVRKYFIYDRSSFSDFVDLLNQEGVKDCLYTDISIDSILEKRVIDAKKQANIYDVDQGVLAEFSKKMENLEGVRKNIVELINTATTINAEIQSACKNSIRDIKEHTLQELKTLETKYLDIKTNINQVWNQLIGEKKEDLNQEKNIIKSDLEMFAESIKNDFISAINKIETEYNIRLDSLQVGYKDSVQKITDDLKKDGRLKEIAENAMFIEGIKKLGDRKVTTNIISSDNETVKDANIVVGAPGVILPVVEQDRPIDNTVNFYLDNNIPLKDRIEKLKRVKEQMQSKGEMFNDSFDDVVIALMLGEMPYLWGQSGCGKTYMMEYQIPKIFGMKIVKQGYIEYDQDILGYNNAGTGAYVASNFYRCYKYGDMISFDEIDNGRANATVVLNRFDGDSFIFPNGEEVKKHPNFRMITSGNTRGMGRDSAYSTRVKLDESTLQRVTPIEINFDNRVDKKILENYPEWYQFAMNFRKVILQREMPGNFTTRDSVSIRRILDQKAFTDEQILKMHFIETKTNDELLMINKEMNSQELEYDSNSAKILVKFKKILSNKGIIV